MKTPKYLLLSFIFLLSSCYIYKPFAEKEDAAINQKSGNASSEKSSKIKADKTADATTATKSIVEEDTLEVVEEPKSNQLSDETRPSKEEMVKEKQQAEENKENKGSFTRSDGSVAGNSKSGNKSKQTNKTTTEPNTKERGIKGKLQPNKYYKIYASGKQYKIQVDRWEGDTLVSHKIRQPKKQFKFHKNDIEEETILERRFSKPYSDLFTVGAYAVGAAAVLLLIL